MTSSLDELKQKIARDTAARAQADNARAEAEKQLAAHAAELQALGQTASGLTEQREKLTASLSDAQMQRLTCEKDVGLHEAALETLKGRSGEAEARRRELNAAMAAAQATIERNELQAAEIERTYEAAIDAGINLNMPYGFSFGIVSRNMNGRYYMTAFDGFSKFGADPFGGNPASGSKFSFSSDAITLSFSSSWRFSSSIWHRCVE